MKARGLAVLLFGTILSSNVFAVDTNGTCGTNCSWKIENDVLTVYPTVAGQQVVMDNYSGVLTGEEESVYKARTGAPWGESYQTIKEVVIGDGITTVSERAFQGLRNVDSVSMPDSLTTISKLAFDRMPNLTSVDIPNSVTTIGQSAFQLATGLENITMSNSLTTIGENAFSGASSLTELTLPDSLTSIGRNAFYNASSLTSVTIPEGITEIGIATFYGASNLTEVNLPSTLIAIGDGAFAHSWNLASIEFPDGLKTIGEAAFEGTSLTSVELPNSVTSIGDYAFGQAYAYNEYLTGRINNIVLSENLEYIGSVAFSRNEATSIILPESLFEGDRELNPYAFEYAGVTKIYCPEGNEKCMNFQPLHCTGDLSADLLCSGDIVPSSISLQIDTYRKDANGNYIMNGIRYSSFADMAQNRNAHPMRRMYTVEEAAKASKDTGNTIKLRYK